MAIKEDVVKAYALGDDYLVVKILREAVKNQSEEGEEALIWFGGIYKPYEITEKFRKESIVAN